MRRIWLVFLVIFALLGCGGGGISIPATATLTGRILQISTGGAPNPRATVQVGSATVLTDASDGSFQLVVPTGTTSIIVDTHASSGVWTFTIAPATGVADVGDLWVGPNKVTLQGKVIKSSDGSAIAGAAISFAGRIGTTNASGLFSIAEVAYDNANQAAFWGVIGAAKATGFFKGDFSASPNVAVASIVTVDDIPLTPSSDVDPPPVPYNIWGRVNPGAQASGTIVTLKLAGTSVRIVNVGADGAFYFWVAPGSYTIEAVKGTLTDTQSVTLTRTNEVKRQDINLH